MRPVVSESDKAQPICWLDFNHKNVEVQFQLSVYCCYFSPMCCCFSSSPALTILDIFSTSPTS